MTREEIKSACERLFQNGGSRHQVRAADGSIQWDAASSKLDAMAYAARGQVVWSRTKVGGRYDWTATKVAA